MSLLRMSLPDSTPLTFGTQYYTTSGMKSRKNATMTISAAYRRLEAMLGFDPDECPE